MKVVPPPTRCEIREGLRVAYQNAEAGTAKHLNIFKALDAHEKKHGCGAKLACWGSETDPLPETES
jgi:hypothetical protein